MKWLTQQFVPNLEPRSLLVVDNAPYHNEKGPLHKTKKQDMKDWLLKYDIYQLMELHKPRLLPLDETAKKEGQTV